MGLTLYSARFDSVPVIGCSPPSWAVWMTCVEKGIEFEHHQLDFEKREHKSEDFLAINPKGTLPALFDDGRLVSDTRAMLQCIERRPGPKLLGETPELRARGTQMLSLGNDLKDAGMAWLSATMKQEAQATELRPLYVEQLERLAGELTSGPFLAPADVSGSRPGLADLLCYAYVATSVRQGLSVQKWPQLELWLRILDGWDCVRETRPEAFASPA